jgi:tRNA 2-thiouridine synthesizing protein A
MPRECRNLDEEFLDLKGLKCPLPVLKTRKAMRAMAPGTRLRVATTDPLARIDMPNFCRENGHLLIDVCDGHDCLIFVIEKGSA